MLNDSVFDLEIMLLAQSGFKIDSVTRLDKMLFLLYKTGLFDECFDKLFEEYGRPHKFGPFTLSLLDDLDMMESESMIEWSGDSIQMTPAFRVYGSRWRFGTTMIQMVTIKMVATMCESMPLERLLEKCYTMSLNSV